MSEIDEEIYDAMIGVVRFTSQRITDEAFTVEESVEIVDEILKLAGVVTPLGKDSLCGALLTIQKDQWKCTRPDGHSGRHREGQWMWERWLDAPIQVPAPVIHGCAPGEITMATLTLCCGRTIEEVDGWSDVFTAELSRVTCSAMKRDVESR